MRPFLAVLVILAAACLNASAADWERLAECRLVADEYGDGDSFHVRQGDKEFIFRLYFVDSPESDNRFPDRVAEQAAYFGITPAAALAIGEKAKEFSFSALARPFTVWTKWQDARGASKQHRFYAVVTTPDGSLSSLLVTNGLARVFGTKTVLPDNMKAATYVAKLLALEGQAKAGKRGGWAGGDGDRALKNALDFIPVY